MANTQEWVCTNDKCKALLILQPENGSSIPRCSCGSLMKKVYSAPKLTPLASPHPAFVQEPVGQKR